MKKRDMTQFTFENHILHNQGKKNKNKYQIVIEKIPIKTARHSTVQYDEI